MYVEMGLIPALGGGVSSLFVTTFSVTHFETPVTVLSVS